MQDLPQRVDSVIRHEIDVTRAQLLRNRVEVISGGELCGRAPLRLDYAEAGTAAGIGAADYHRDRHGGDADDHIPFDGKRVLTSDDILVLEELPRTLTVVGAGVIGGSMRRCSRRWVCG